MFLLLGSSGLKQFVCMCGPPLAVVGFAYGCLWWVKVDLGFDGCGYVLMCELWVWFVWWHQSDMGRWLWFGGARLCKGNQKKNKKINKNKIIFLNFLLGFCLRACFDFQILEDESMFSDEEWGWDSGRWTIVWSFWTKRLF